ncbi:hypothetical protein QUF80_23655 [Desulfococcaceae bacterium HSG8]|nr:hypothetical protein [Desulfococcaceae bacterium HSG8]
MDANLETRILDALYKYYQDYPGAPEMPFKKLYKAICVSRKDREKVHHQLYLLEKKGWAESESLADGQAGMAKITPDGIQVAKDRISREDSTHPKCGSLTPKMCNRDNETDVFWDFFINACKTRSGRPQFYFIHGDRGQGHESFITRMIKNDIRKYAENKMERDRVVVLPKMVRWPDRGKLKNRRSGLAMRIFREFDEGFADTDFSVNHLQSLFDGYHFISISHNIDISDWQKTDEELINWYIGEYWAGLESDDDTPQFLIFFNMKYSGSKLIRMIKKKLGCHCSSEDLICELADNIDRDKCPCLPSIKLRPVGPGDLEDWFIT